MGHFAGSGGGIRSRSASNIGLTWVARKAGHYDYVCTLHPTMKASLLVE
jgi:plastocyanin